MADKKREPTKKEIAALVPDEDAKAYLASLEREKEGYEAKAKVAHTDKDADVEAQAKADAAAVTREIARVKKEGVTDRKAAASKVIDAAAEALAPTGGPTAPPGDDEDD
jgi:uncharacterized protein YdaT